MKGKLTKSKKRKRTNKYEDKNLKTNSRQRLAGDCGFDRAFLRFRSSG
jgi:hypothetical protein